MTVIKSIFTLLSSGFLLAANADYTRETRGTDKADVLAKIQVEAGRTGAMPRVHSIIEQKVAGKAPETVARTTFVQPPRTPIQPKPVPKPALPPRTNPYQKKR